MYMVAKSEQRSNDSGEKGNIEIDKSVQVDKREVREQFDDDGDNGTDVELVDLTMDEDDLLHSSPNQSLRFKGVQAKQCALCPQLINNDQYYEIRKIGDSKAIDKLLQTGGIVEKAIRQNIAQRPSPCPKNYGWRGVFICDAHVIPDSLGLGGCLGSTPCARKLDVNEALLSFYTTNPSPSLAQMEELSTNLGIKPIVVKNYFTVKNKQQQMTRNVNVAVIGSLIPGAQTPSSPTPSSHLRARSTFPILSPRTLKDIMSGVGGTPSSNTSRASPCTGSRNTPHRSTLPTRRTLDGGTDETDVAFDDNNGDHHNGLVDGVGNNNKDTQHIDDNVKEQQEREDNGSGDRSYIMNRRRISVVPQRLKVCSVCGFTGDRNGFLIVTSNVEAEALDVEHGSTVVQKLSVAPSVYSCTEHVDNVYAHRELEERVLQGRKRLRTEHGGNQ